MFSCSGHTLSFILGPYVACQGMTLLSHWRFLDNHRMITSFKNSTYSNHVSMCLSRCKGAWLATCTLHYYRPCADPIKSGLQFCSGLVALEVSTFHQKFYVRLLQLDLQDFFRHKWCGQIYILNTIPSWCQIISFNFICVLKMVLMDGIPKKRIQVQHENYVNKDKGM